MAKDTPTQADNETRHILPVLLVASVIIAAERTDPSIPLHGYSVPSACLRQGCHSVPRTPPKAHHVELNRFAKRPSELTKAK
eukprot:1968989-Amphidinium_carterae.1